MALFKKLLWVVFFFLATFCWVVLFEHGFDGFVDGLSVEFDKLVFLFTGSET